MFGAHVRLDLIWEWLSLKPLLGNLPQISHFAIIAPPLMYDKSILSYKSVNCNQEKSINKYEKHKKYIIMVIKIQLEGRKPVEEYNQKRFR